MWFAGSPRLTERRSSAGAAGGKPSSRPEKQSVAARVDQQGARMPGMETILGLAEAKRRFTELVERVSRRERFVVSWHGKPAVALVSPWEALGSAHGRPLGLAAFAGATCEWDGSDALLPDEIAAVRGRSRDRAGPGLDEAGERRGRTRLWTWLAPTVTCCMQV